MKSPIPILRIFDEAKAKEFYVDFLGFNIDWEHRFGENSPLYMQVSQDGCVIHLSEHHGDGCPGATLRVETAELDDLCTVLRAKNYKNFKPGEPLDTPWKTREICAPDPFGNKLYFYKSKGMTPSAPPPIAEPNLFLPRGRIGICSMLFRWIACCCILAAAGLLLRQIPESSRHVISACIAYPVYAFMIVTGIKRAHDMGYSAWGIIFISLLPILFLLPGARVSNRYGPVPTRWI